MLASIPASMVNHITPRRWKAYRIGSVRACSNGANPISVVVPCHRVIGADGSLTGYGGGIARKRWLLNHEGAAFRDAPVRAARAA